MDARIDAVGAVEGTLNVSTENVVLHGELTPKAQLSGVVYLPKERMVKDYDELTNKPSIESVELTGNKTFEELGLSKLTTEELLSILGEDNNG